MTVAACGGVVALGGPKDGAPADSAATVDDGLGTMPTGTLKLASKIDLLLMIDNSSSMKDKQELLRKSLPDLLTRLVSPRCVDPAGAVVGTSTNGVCTAGRPEFAPVSDLHIGILSSSLGGRGGDVCPDTGHFNDDAHLLQRGDDGSPVPDAASGFLAFGPGGITDPDRLRTDLASLVSGVHDDGCGLEAQLESWYRFLVQPDPYVSIKVDATNRAAVQGVDETILQQRRNFLRPDSLLAVLMLTDEEDASVDPFEVGGQGWAFVNSEFPGSPIFRADGKTTTAPRASSVCASAPGAAECTSCGFAATCDAAGDPLCQNLRNDPSCQLHAGYYFTNEEDLNVRFHHMKQRFGVDPQYPITRYANGLSSAKVPDRTGEHDPLPAAPSTPDTARMQLPYKPSYLGNNNCSNPIFSTNLPSVASDELCNLPPGPRSRDLVVFGAITGVPSSLIPGRVLSEPDWIRILGKDPRHFDETGIDPHMVQSVTPRAGLPGVTAADDADPIHGRERDTAGLDLQFACTFPLETPFACTGLAACDCTLPGGGTSPGVDVGGPLCGKGDQANVQLRGKAYPGTRQLEVARLLGSRAIVSSLCPVHATEATPGDALFGYRSAMSALGDRMALSLLPAD